MTEESHRNPMTDLAAAFDKSGTRHAQVVQLGRRRFPDTPEPEHADGCEIADVADVMGFAFARPILLNPPEPNVRVPC